MEENNIHQRVLRLRDIALGLKKTVKVNSDLAPASYDCTVDSLLALYKECVGASSLAKDKNVLKFSRKYEKTVSVLEKLRMSIEDFEVKNIIGRGHFGEVVLCRQKITGDIFAMKIMKKAHILQQPDAAFFSAERDIMAWSTSQWLTSLHYAFQDSTSLYLVMDYHPGGDLLSIMERHEGMMHEDETRFYLAEIAAGLHDLHRLGFVHRDVKPENVLIARSGHIKLVDFGSAARLNSEGKVIESQLPVGTPEYISPEVLTSLDKQADYGICCDWWSLGIIAYELLYQATPFEGDTTSQTYSNIMKYKTSLSFAEEPKTSGEKSARELIKGLLTDMKGRLTYADIQSHAFFDHTDWNHLLDAIPPHIPTVSGPDDVSNFDVFEPLKEDDLRFPDLPHKTSGFSGRSLPFVGFTFSGAVFSEDFTDSVLPLESSSKETEDNDSEISKRILELTKKELEKEKGKRILFEKECAVYKTQLEDYHRKLEMEKSDRHKSDSRACLLLQEVREKGKVAQQLREEQSRKTEAEYSMAVDQLELERQEASKRLQRLQFKLKEMQGEMDLAYKKGSEYKAKLVEAKENGRKGIADLQASLAKVSKASKQSSTKVETLQNDLLKAQGRYADALKKIESSETAGKKMEAELHKLKSELDQLSKANEDHQKQSVSYNRQLKDMENQADDTSLQNQVLERGKLSLESRVRDLGQEIDELKKERDKLVMDGQKVSQNLKMMSQELQKKKETISALENKLVEANTQKVTLKRISTNEKLKIAVDRIAVLEKENTSLKENLFSISNELNAQVLENRGVIDRLKQLDEKDKKSASVHKAEMQFLQNKLSDATTTVIQHGEKLREARKARRELDQRNTDLTVKLHNAQRELQEYSANAANIDTLKQRELEIVALKSDLISDQKKLREITSSRDKLNEKFCQVKKQFKEQELNYALLQRTVKSLEEELKESKISTEELQKQETHWKSIKNTIESDLEKTETKLEVLSATYEKEKKSRLKAEHQITKMAEDTERMICNHLTELQKSSNQLLEEKQLVTKHSSRILELEKELRMNAQNLKVVQRELGTEKAVSSKFYDELQLKSRELGKLKAAHSKLLREAQDVKSELVQREQALNEHKLVFEERQLQLTRLQGTVAQQSKLINFLQGVGASPESKGLGKIRKGLKLGRKGRDPAKEIAEWYKLKGIAKRDTGSSSGVVQSMSDINMSSSHSKPPVTTSSSNPSLLASSSSTASASSSARPPPPLKRVRMSSGTLPMKSSDGDHDPETSTPFSGPPSTSSSENSSKNICSTNKANSNQVFLNELKQIIGQHSIPHKFRGITKSGLRSNHTCAACNGPIKALQKLIKCSHCHIHCHAQCVDAIPNNCGLPQELSSYTELKEPSSKRRKVNTESTTSSDPLIPTVTHQETVDKSSPVAHQQMPGKPVPKKKPKKRNEVTLIKVVEGVSDSSNMAAASAVTAQKEGREKRANLRRTQKQKNADVSHQVPHKSDSPEMMDNGALDMLSDVCAMKIRSKTTQPKVPPVESDSSITMDIEACDSTPVTTVGKNGREIVDKSGEGKGREKKREEMVPKKGERKGEKKREEMVDKKGEGRGGEKKREEMVAKKGEKKKEEMVDKKGEGKGGEKKREEMVAKKGEKKKEEMVDKKGEGKGGEKKREEMVAKKGERKGEKKGKETVDKKEEGKGGDIKKKERIGEIVDRKEDRRREEVLDKKEKKLTDKGKVMVDIIGDTGNNDNVVRNEEHVYVGFESSRVIKMEMMSHPRGGIMVEGCLVLTKNTLSLYDRDPRGVTRKPIHHILLNEPRVAHVIVPSVEIPHASPSTLMKAFEVQLYSSKGSKQLKFVASSLQSKIDWVEAIQKVLSVHIEPKPTPREPLADRTTMSKSSPRKLKEVAIVPLPVITGTNTDLRRSTSPCPTSDGAPLEKRVKLSTDQSDENDDLEFSIRSSMLNSPSDGESSFI